MTTPTLIRDLRHGLRQLSKAPGFILTAVLTLGLGIGATTAIFTLVYDVLLKPLPYTHSDRLVVTEEQVAEFRDLYPKLPMNANHFTAWQQNSRSFESLAVMKQQSMPLGASTHPVQAEVLLATPGIFPVLDSAPQIGRAFTPEEAQPGHEHVALLLHELWRQQFQGDRRILGKTITLNGFPYTVIGVMPPSFHVPLVSDMPASTDRAKPIQVLVPLAFTKDELQAAMGDFNYFGLARLKAGVSVAQANAEINALQERIAAGLSAQEKATLAAVLTRYQDALTGNNRKALLILLAAVAALLLVGCVNITNLLLARAAGRRQQMAVAAVLGARPLELLRISLRETAVLATLGTGLGVVLAAILVPLLEHYLPPALDFRGALHLDWAGAACAIMLAVLATLLAGAIPAWISSRTQPYEVLHSESRLASESRGSKRVRRTLVGVEVAVSVALVLLTGLVTASLVRLMHIDRGFAADHLLTVNVDLPSKSYSDQQPRIAFYEEVLRRLHQLPGMDGAGLVSVLPLAGDQWVDMVRLPGEARPIMQLPTEHFRWVSPGYCEVLHLPLVAGRLLSDNDEGKHYAMVSELTARTLWPDKNPVGQQFSRAGNLTEEPFTVIGVVGNARTVSLASADPMVIYIPYWYRSNSNSGIVVRTRQAPSAMAETIRKIIWSVDPAASVPTMRTLDGGVEDSVANRRFEMDLLLVFAVSSLLLSALGVYGVVTYSVVQRQREIGVRLALGAQRKNIYTLVLRDGLTPVLAGTVAGIAGAMSLFRVIRSLLFQVSPYNPVIMAAAVFVLIAVGAAACLLPARRASAVDPVRSLGTE
jgi:predicted permease